MINPVSFINEFENPEEFEEEEEDEESEQKLNFNDDEELIEEEASIDEINSNDEDGAKENQDDLDPVDDAFSHHLNMDFEFEDINDIELDNLNELLFCVQGIGAFIDKEKKIYQKNEFWKPNLRDIHRFLRKRDDPENPKCKFALLSWKIPESDIIPLILNYENEESIQLLGLVILTDLSEPLPDLVEKRSEMESMLTDLQEYIANSNLIPLLSRSLAHATSQIHYAYQMKEELKSVNIENLTNQEEIDAVMEKKKGIAKVESTYPSLIELIFVFLKQILQITDSVNIIKNVNNKILLLKKFEELKIFDAIVFHARHFNTDFYKRLSGTLLELVFFISQPFSIGHFDFEENQTGNKTALQKLLEDEKRLKQARLSQISCRPNNFGTTFKINRPFDGSSFIVSNVNQLVNNKQNLCEKINNLGQQRKRPMRKLKLKKTELNRTGGEIKLVNDLIVSDIFSTLLDHSHKSLLASLSSFFQEFLNNCLNPMVKYLTSEIKKGNNFDKYDFYHVLMLLIFFLDFHRARENKLATINKGNYPGFNVDLIKECMTTEILEMAYELAYKESMVSKKSELQLFQLFSATRYLKNVLLISLDINKYAADFNLEQNIVIQDKIITQDFRKIFVSIFNFYNENFHPKRLLYDSIELIDVYYSCIDTYSQKRKLMKKIKKKSKKRDDEDDDEKKDVDDFIEKNSDDEDDKDEHTGSVNLSMDSAENAYLEKDLDIKEESMALHDYIIISKILCLFNSDSTKLNTTLFELKRDNSKVIKLISNIFVRITKTSEEPWIFYQMDYLNIFHKLINDQLFSSSIYFQSFYNCIKWIIKSFFAAMRKNKLLGIESLFRFSSLLKDSILNNYEEIKNSAIYKAENEDYYEKNLIEDDLEYDGTNVNVVRIDEGEKTKKIKKSEKVMEVDEEPPEDSWTENEDLVLIKNYLEYQNHEEVYDILESLFALKTKKQIKMRIKVLKLKKGEEKAMKILNKMHKKNKEKDDKIFDIIMELADYCKDDVVKMHIESTIIWIKEQLESFKVRKGLLTDPSTLNCDLIPTEGEQIETLEVKAFQEFIQYCGITPPNHTNSHWTLDSKYDSLEIGIIIEKLTSFEMILQENLETEIPQREAERKKAKEEKKIRKHRKLKKEKKRKKSSSPIKSEILSVLEKNSDIGSKSKIFTENQSVKSAISVKSETNESKIAENFVKKKRLKKGLKEEEDDFFNYD